MNRLTALTVGLMAATAAGDLLPASDCAERGGRQQRRRAELAKLIEATCELLDNLLGVGPRPGRDRGGDQLFGGGAHEAAMVL